MRADWGERPCRTPWRLPFLIKTARYEARCYIFFGKLIVNQTCCFGFRLQLLRRNFLIFEELLACLINASIEFFGSSTLLYVTKLLLQRGETVLRIERDWLDHRSLFSWLDWRHIRCEVVCLLLQFGSNKSWRLRISSILEIRLLFLLQLRRWMIMSCIWCFFKPSDFEKLFELVFRGG